MVGAKSVETDVLMGNPRSFASEITRKGRDRFVDAIVIPHRQGIYFMVRASVNKCIDRWQLVGSQN
jgi:hypothetical protein